jgi:hypothetical protein
VRREDLRNDRRLNEFMGCGGAGLRTDFLARWRSRPEPGG